MTANKQFEGSSTISLPNLSIPPPSTPNLSAPPPPLNNINNSLNYQPRFSSHREVNRGFFKPFKPYHTPKSIPGGQDIIQDEFDGKRLRKSVMRKTVDYNSSIIKSLENRIWQRDYRDRRALQPDVIYYPELLPPPSYIDNPINAVTTKFVKTATNKMRCPIFCMAWTPEGRRLVTGASSGEFTLWNGLTFNFETILQAHDSPVRTMVWSHNESWMVTGDHAGYVKYWQSNMNNVKMFQAHKEAIRGISFSPTDHKLATCSDDGTVRVWDFLRCNEERILRGHGADVKCIHWHPQKSLILSGSKDNQQPVKLWDPKVGQSLATLHAHKSTVMDVKWNDNGNWLITASRDHLLKLFDLRNLNQEVQTFRGHKKEASSVAWHPSHEGLFCSGGSDGAILFWHVGADKEVGAIEQAHDSIVWTLAWHPLGHILCSGSNDHTSKFWTRNRPGDQMKDKYNLNTLPAGAGNIEDHEVADDSAVIPGMGPEDRINITPEAEEQDREIPGLDLDLSIEENKKTANKKVPYSKPIPRNFQAQWNEVDAEDQEQTEVLTTIVNQILETTPGAVPLSEVSPNAIILHGKMITVEPGSKLAAAIAQGTDAINKLVEAGEIEELRDVNANEEKSDDSESYLQDDEKNDFPQVPDIQLPPPLPSSRFSQNPELFKTFKEGEKRQFDQLMDWNETTSNENVNRNYQSAFNGSHLEDSIDLDAIDDDDTNDYTMTEDFMNVHLENSMQHNLNNESDLNISNFSKLRKRFISNDNPNEYDKCDQGWNDEPINSMKNILNSESNKSSNLGYSQNKLSSSLRMNNLDDGLMRTNVLPPPLPFNTNVPPPGMNNFLPNLKSPLNDYPLPFRPMVPFPNPNMVRMPHQFHGGNFDRGSFNPNFRSLNNKMSPLGGPRMYNNMNPFVMKDNLNLAHLSRGPNDNRNHFHNRGRGREERGRRGRDY